MSFHCPDCQTLVDDSDEFPFDDMFLCDACGKVVSSERVFSDTELEMMFVEIMGKEHYEEWSKEASKSDKQRDAEAMWWFMVIVLGGSYILYFLGCI